ncbi:DUF6415 family natural product biosynthesis protein [Streptomyces uncialis]|uniref:DUF6415 family natural product biosynthesis protein n=1 Tax=Streptomyces uncialis TaxID=1048205 RepID=UPI00378FC4F0
MLVAGRLGSQDTAPLERRGATGEGWQHPLAKPGHALAPSSGVSTESELLRQLLEAMRRDLEADATHVRVTVAAIEQSVEYLLSPHLDQVDDRELDAAVVTLREYLATLVDEAEAALDSGRVVVRAMVDRARGVAGRAGGRNSTEVREAAKTARDLLTLMKHQGWEGPEPIAPGSGP